MEMPFGKYKGWKIEELPDDYVRWFAGNANMRGGIAKKMQAEYEDRFGSISPNASRDEEIAELREQCAELAEERDDLTADLKNTQAQISSLQAAVRSLQDEQRRSAVYMFRTDDKTFDACIKIIEAGYRHLALKNHPDAGGDNRAMVAVNGAIELLRGAVKRK